MGRLTAFQRTFNMRGTKGYVLLDVLTGLFIASIALLLALGGIALAARTAKQCRERVIQLIAAGNEHAEHRKVVFIEETLKE